MRKRYVLTTQGRFALIGALRFSGYLGGIEEAAGELPQPDGDSQSDSELRSLPCRRRGDWPTWIERVAS